MLRLILSPEWFLGADIIIDFFSFLVLLTFAIISAKYYSLSKNKKLLYLGLSFFLVGLGELSKIIMNIGLYYDFTIAYNVGRMIITSHVVESIDAVYYIGFFLHRFLIMLGFYFLYYTTKKNKSKSEHLLVLYFIAISAIFTNDMQYLFNITVTIFLVFIFVNYLKIYRKTRAENTKTLATGFFLLLISYIVMSFSRIDSNIYITANLLQLASYIVFLYIIIKIYKHGKKK
ncbi:MAG: hypothetical protein AABX71_01425 [Nanoarchaeota archaeon]